jgi:dinuclear metal center YbgI/SA1388 family protein
MHRRLLEEYLNKYLDVASIKDSCPNGIQVEGKEEIQQIATAVSANLATIEQAVQQGVDALIVHHGLFWQADPYPITGIKKNKIEQLLKNQISLFAYHLPLDIHPEVGNNWQAARDLGWKEITPFGQYHGTPIGVKGIFAPLAIETFVTQLEAYYEHQAITALGGKAIISSGALISGGAYKVLDQAAEEGLGCFVTGNFDEPAWAMAHENQVHFLALGHSATERVGPKALANHIQKELGLSCSFIDITNPF